VSGGTTRGTYTVPWSVLEKFMFERRSLVGFAAKVMLTDKSWKQEFYKATPLKFVRGLLHERWIERMCLVASDGYLEIAKRCSYLHILSS